MASAIFEMARPHSAGVADPHVLKAPAAPSQARRASSSSDRAASANTSSVVGLMSSGNRPETGSSTLPLITLSIRRFPPACTIVTSMSAVSFWKEKLQPKA